jgi:hypothetical protein
MLCAACQSVDIPDIVTALSELNVIEAVHHPYWKSLRETARAGCQLCALLQEAVIRAYQEAFDWDRDEVNQAHMRKDEEDTAHSVISSSESGDGLILDRRLRNLSHLGVVSTIVLLGSRMAWQCGLSCEYVLTEVH